MTASDAKPSVLLVDDTKANLITLQALLDNMNCEMVTAGSGNEALAQLLKREFALMLLDVQMPEMDGFEVAKYARENPKTRDVPIIFLTAMNETEDGKLHGYEMGAVDFIFKPVNPYILRTKISVFLELYENRRQLKRLIDQLEQKNKELEAFSYSVSHDLRAPLRAIDGFSDALLTEYADKFDEEGRHFLKRIRAGTLRMSELIDDLLNLSRINRAPLRQEKINVSDLAEKVVDEMRRRDPSRSVTFEIAKNLMAFADARLVTILLENLLGNAWKFTSKKTDAKISLGQETKKDRDYFYIRDNGAGFDMTYADRLFQPFHRLHMVSEFDGTGIGLAIVYRIISRHGGDIFAEGAVGQGASVYFQLGD